MVFDNKGLLYFGVGDRGLTGEQFVQDLSVHNGKIRLRDDGSAAEIFRRTLRLPPGLLAVDHYAPAIQALSITGTIGVTHAKHIVIDDGSGRVHDLQAEAIRRIASG